MKQKGFHLQCPELEDAIRRQLRISFCGLDKLAERIGVSKSKITTALYNMYDVYETDDGMLGIL